MRAAGLIISVFFSALVTAQQDTIAADSSAQKRAIYRGPRTASILSAIIPGAGQVYNKKYWKLPIIYGGMGGLGYLFSIHNTEYQYFRRNLAAIHDKDNTTENVTPFSSDQLVTLKNDARRLRDLSAFGVALIYLLNIVDANVDAHLKTFDVSDDLSLELSPSLIPGGSAVFAGGLKLKLIIN